MLPENDMDRGELKGLRVYPTAVVMTGGVRPLLRLLPAEAPRGPLHRTCRGEVFLWLHPAGGLRPGFSGQQAVR